MWTSYFVLAQTVKNTVVNYAYSAQWRSICMMKRKTDMPPRAVRG